MYQWWSNGSNVKATSFKHKIARVCVCARVRLILTNIKNEQVVAGVKQGDWTLQLIALHPGVVLVLQKEWT